MIKIRLFAWWTDSNSITERFKRQFIGSYFSNDQIKIVTDESYDYAIVFGYTKENLRTDKNHTIFFLQEPPWSNNWDREAYKKSNRVFCPTKESYGNYDENISHPAYMFYGGHGDAHFDLDFILNYNALDKSKNTSFIVTYRSSSPLTGGHENNIYRERVKLAEALLNVNSNVDIYGQLWEYYPYSDKPNLKKGIYTKFDGIKDYRYSIGIENSEEKNYITEKLYDVIFFNSLPVYAGAPNIKDINLISDITILLPPIQNTEECVEFINTQLTEELYNKKRDIINNIKHQIFSSAEYNIWKKIIKEIL